MDLKALRIEEFNPDRHSNLVEPLTQLLHEAYASLAEQGFRYFASYQSPEQTFDRLTRGRSFLAFLEGKLAGTISFYWGKPDSKCEYYRRSGLVYFGQYAVKPQFQGLGIASKLLEGVEKLAKGEGATEIALDTAEEASELIKIYEKWGYAKVGTTKWNVTNYRSVIMSKLLV